MNKNNFAVTPPMGWNSYDYYDTTVSEEQVKANADYLSKHLKQHGWEYVVVDIQWYAYEAGSQREQFQYIPFSKLEMDGYGRLLPCLDRFPSSKEGKGFGPLADYIHQLGLKFGIHIMRGIPRCAAENHLPVFGTDVTADQIADPGSICNWNPDMYGVVENEAGQAYYDSIIELYASWGVDFIKCDDICNTHAYPHKPESGIKEMIMIQKAIQKCCHPIVLSLSPGPALLEQAEGYRKYANMWRISDDFWDGWNQLRKMFDYCEMWQTHVERGAFPDCDMLPLGQIGQGFGQERTSNFTRNEQKTMMTLWCIFRSPLMLGAELTKMEGDTLSLLTNDKLLCLLGDGYRGRQVRKNSMDAVWISDNVQKKDYYIAIFNFTDQRNHTMISREELNEVSLIQLEKGTISLWNVWENKTDFMEAEYIQTDVESHGVVLYQVINEV